LRHFDKSAHLLILRCGGQPPKRTDRAQYGFTPLRNSGPVSIERKSTHGGYDAMLHFGGKASRTIAFRWDGKDYQWLGEQESFEGPRMWDTPDALLSKFAV
jgi:hypothetical protein